MSAREPGLDRHEWETELQQLEPQLRDAPAEALPELSDLVERMLVEVGFDVNDPVAREGEEREVVAEYTAAREVSDRVERAEDVDPGDVASAVNGMLAVYEFLVAERPS